MRLRIASWNVNSVRLRTAHLARFAIEHAPDVICLQEIKCQAPEFPAQDFLDAGYPYLRIRGQKGWHGVAIASRLPIEDAPELDVCREGHARTVSARVAGVEIQNFYVPAGGDVPDPEANPKFAHKLNFFERLTEIMSQRDPKDPLVIAGDLNVAPGEFDVWNHKHMSKVVSHTPVEVAAMAAWMATGWVDAMRHFVPTEEKLYTWWSYRNRDWRVNNRGRRLDHVWATPELVLQSMQVLTAARDWERTSDHVPVCVAIA